MSQFSELDRQYHERVKALAKKLDAKPYGFTPGSGCSIIINKECIEIPESLMKAIEEIK